MHRWILWLFLLATPGLAEPPAGVWQVSEVFGGPIRTTWNFDPATRTFQSRSQNGSQAFLRLEEYDDQHIVVTRQDSNGPTAGLRARYQGLRTAQGYAGQVTWTWLDQARRGTWSVQVPAEAPAP